MPFFKNENTRSLSLQNEEADVMNRYNGGGNANYQPVPEYNKDGQKNEYFEVPLNEAKGLVNVQCCHQLHGNGDCRPA